MSNNPTTAAFSVAEALVRLNLSRDTFYKLVRDGKLTARKVGSKTLVLDSDLRAFLEGLPTTLEQPGRAPKRKQAAIGSRP